MTEDPLDSTRDPFGPPAISILVRCLHCEQEYDSYRIERRVEPDRNGQPRGWWCCPTEGCDGKGFGFDIFAIGNEYRRAHGGGWFRDDEDATEILGLGEEP